jgi:hypothetical protein
MKIASYKSIRPGFSGIFSKLVRWWTNSEYSHTELIFSDGTSASSSFIDGGVRFKEISYDNDHWDFIELPESFNEKQARVWFEVNKDKKYDVLGLLGFIWKRGTQDKNKFYCNEAIGEALGIKDSWRFDPGSFAVVISEIIKYSKKDPS